MTYQGQPSRSSNIVLKVLVVATIVWVAYWAATGGIDEIPMPETTAATSTTVGE